MQIGSLVELIYDGWIIPEPYRVKFVTFPVTKVIYTVRSIDYFNGVRLEEIINPVQYWGNILGFCEPTFAKKRFRELQEPMKIHLEEIFQNQIT